MADLTHECPATACTREIRIDMLMCRSHWYMVPPPLRNAVWAAWQEGAGAGTAAHNAALRAAIKAVNDKLAAKGVTGG